MALVQVEKKPEIGKRASQRDWWNVLDPRDSGSNLRRESSFGCAYRQILGIGVQITGVECPLAVHIGKSQGSGFKSLAWSVLRLCIGLYLYP